MNWQTKLLHYSLRPSECLEIQTSLHFTSNMAFLELRIQFIPCHYRIENYHACCFSPGQIQTLKRKKLCTYPLFERLNSSNLVPCASDHIKHFIWLFVKTTWRVCPHQINKAFIYRGLTKFSFNVSYINLYCIYENMHYRLPTQTDKIKWPKIQKTEFWNKTPLFLLSMRNMVRHQIKKPWFPTSQPSDIFPWKILQGQIWIPIFWQHSEFLLPSYELYSWK